MHIYIYIYISLSLSFYVYIPASCYRFMAALLANWRMAVRYLSSMRVIDGVHERISVLFSLSIIIHLLMCLLFFFGPLFCLFCLVWMVSFLS